MSKWLIALLSLTFSGCVIMSRRDYDLITYGNRLIGRMEGMAWASEVYRSEELKKKKSAEARPEDHVFEGLAEKAGKETDEKLRDAEEELGIEP